MDLGWSRTQKKVVWCPRATLCMGRLLLLQSPIPAPTPLAGLAPHIQSNSPHPAFDVKIKFLCAGTISNLVRYGFRAEFLSWSACRAAGYEDVQTSSVLGGGKKELYTSQNPEIYPIRKKQPSIKASDKGGEENC